MKHSLTFFAVTASLASLSGCFWSIQDRQNGALGSGIVGGQEVPVDAADAGALVLLFNFRDGFICTGTLIRENAVLTAGHCVTSKTDKNVESPDDPVLEPEELKIVFGVRPVFDEEPVSRDITAVRRHEGFRRSDEERNDVAVLTFAGPRPANSRVARLPHDDEEMTAGMTFKALGYGRAQGRLNRSDEDEGSGLLRMVDLTTYYVFEDQLSFVVDQRPGKGICLGDSGGPALINDKTGAPVVYGIASGVFRIDEIEDMTQTTYDFCTEFSIFMNVTGYKTWIEETLKTME